MEVKTNQIIIDGSLFNIHLIIYEENFSAIDSEYVYCNIYSINKFTHFAYTLHNKFTVNSNFFCFGEIICDDTYFSPVNVKSNYYVYSNTNSKRGMKVYLT